MPYKPCSDNDRKRLEGLIAHKKEGIALAQSAIQSCEQELKQGRWCSNDDFWVRDVPNPEPDCYLCAFCVIITPSNHRCGQSREYGTVCSEYRHFSEV